MKRPPSAAIDTASLPPSAPFARVVILVFVIVFGLFPRNQHLEKRSELLEGLHHLLNLGDGSENAFDPAHFVDHGFDLVEIQIGEKTCCSALGRRRRRRRRKERRILAFGQEGWQLLLLQSRVIR